MTRRGEKIQELVMLKVGETVAEARNNMHIPSSTTSTNQMASSLDTRTTQRSVHSPAKEMDATYAEDHTTIPRSPR